jgi:hypothetical protein
LSSVAEADLAPVDLGQEQAALQMQTTASAVVAVVAVADKSAKIP